MVLFITSRSLLFVDMQHIASTSPSSHLFVRHLLNYSSPRSLTRKLATHEAAMTVCFALTSLSHRKARIRSSRLIPQLQSTALSNPVQPCSHPSACTLSSAARLFIPSRPVDTDEITHAQVIANCETHSCIPFHIPRQVDDEQGLLSVRCACYCGAKLNCTSPCTGWKFKAAPSEPAATTAGARDASASSAPSSNHVSIRCAAVLLTSSFWS